MAKHPDRAAAAHTGPALGDELELEAQLLSPGLRAGMEWLREVAGRLGVPAARRILDLGSGPGVSTAFLAATFPEAQIVAVDRARDLLYRAQARAEHEGVAERVAAHVADLSSDLGDIGTADIIWASMVLHHIGDRQAAIHRFAGLLAPRGLLAIAEAATPPSFLPAQPRVGRPGVEDRRAVAAARGRAAIGTTLPGSTDGDVDADIRALFQRAGLEPVASETFAVHLDAPLPHDARRLAERTLTRLSYLAADHLEGEDRDALAVLLDPTSNASNFYRRSGLQLHIDRIVRVAQGPQAA